MFELDLPPCMGVGTNLVYPVFSLLRSPKDKNTGNMHNSLPMVKILCWINKWIIFLTKIKKFPEKNIYKFIMILESKWPPYPVLTDHFLISPGLFSPI